jgi:hypothetical protein
MSIGVNLIYTIGILMRLAKKTGGDTNGKITHDQQYR